MEEILHPVIISRMWRAAKEDATLDSRTTAPAPPRLPNRFCVRPPDVLLPAPIASRRSVRDASSAGPRLNTNNVATVRAIVPGTPTKKMVSLRIDVDVWRLLAQAAELGFIPSREAAVNSWLREHLSQLFADGQANNIFEHDEIRST